MRHEVGNAGCGSRRLRRRDLPGVGDADGAQRTEDRRELFDEGRRAEPDDRNVMTGAAEARKDPPTP